ncbi:MBL fold metallo-hydrolase [Geomonas sp. RF6]|uniref:MBL fold metallo-hydrolase n=1 Tax=Geomonas sp. RF6 TaxID=2897342 RepID=UPI001E29C8BC|nr:MBL fold metallo-hydrolase [Geomonas sp. RF6]UFS69505.1 MBL fold metallo-hydrolase [Geomonas sp. RF6]
MHGEQYVCLVCGFNMVGFHPDHCPFCGTGKENFITADQCSARYRVQGTPVHKHVTRLNSTPSLGIEHAAYCIDTPGGAIWIDCPSCFDKTAPRAHTILFTHHHFLGACNLYREQFGARVRIHHDDSWHQICRPFIFDDTFGADFLEHGLQAFHIDGHTPGFTMYIFEDVLFICDYVFLDGESMKYNPFGPADRTVAGGVQIAKLLQGKELSTVCGYNYVVPYDEWRRRFEAGPVYAGY